MAPYFEDIALCRRYPVGHRAQFSLITKMRHSRDVPCLRCVCPSLVTMPQLLWVVSWAGLAPLVVGASQVTTVAVVLVGRAASCHPIRQELLWRSLSWPRPPTGCVKLVANLGAVGPGQVCLLGMIEQDHLGRSACQNGWVRQSQSSREPWDGLCSANKVDGKVSELVPTSVGPARQKEGEKNSSYHLFCSQRKFTNLYPSDICPKISH